MTEEKSVAIRFMAPVNENSIRELMKAVDQHRSAGATQFKLLLSTPGGSVFHGLSAYNFLRGIPEKVITHNFGSVDSIGVVVYCAGAERRSVPNARFLLHGVSAQFQGNQSLEEKQLEERLKGLQIDLRNIGRVIASHCGKKDEEVYKAMIERTTLDPEEAKDWGLVQKIQDELVDDGETLVSIG